MARNEGRQSGHDRPAGTIAQDYTKALALGDKFHGLQRELRKFRDIAATIAPEFP